MFRSIGMVFLVAISLTVSESHGMKVSDLGKVLEITESSEVPRMVEAMLKNYDYLEDCRETLSWSMNLTACEQFLGNLIGLKDFLFTTVEDVLTLAEEAETLKAEYVTCSTESIFKQISCYTSVLDSAKALVSEAKVDEKELSTDGGVLVREIYVNAANCFDKGLTSEIFETKMRQCKRKLNTNDN